MRDLSEWLNIEDLHDKNVKGIEVIGGSTVVVYVDDKESAFTVKIAFVNTYHMRVDNFMLGNIIFDIEVYDSNEVGKLERDLVHLLDLNLNNTHQEKILVNYKQLFVSENLLFVLINTSYGLSGSFLCKSIHLLD